MYVCDIFIFLLLFIVTLGIFILSWTHYCDTSITFLWKWITIYIQIKRKKFWIKENDIFILPSSEEIVLEKPKQCNPDQTCFRDSMIIYGADCKGTVLSAEVVRGKFNTAITHICVRQGSDIYYTEGNNVQSCENWRTNTLCMEQLEPMRRWRLVYNGRLL